MSMPKAAVDEYYLFAPAEDDVRLSRQSFDMQ
jgi:hypothetical protein